MIKININILEFTPSVAVVVNRKILENESEYI